MLGRRRISDPQGESRHHTGRVDRGVTKAPIRAEGVVMCGTAVAPPDPGFIGPTSIQAGDCGTGCVRWRAVGRGLQQGRHQRTADTIQSVEHRRPIFTEGHEPFEELPPHSHTPSRPGLRSPMLRKRPRRADVTAQGWRDPTPGATVMTAISGGTAWVRVNRGFGSTTWTSAPSPTRTDMSQSRARLLTDGDAHSRARSATAAAQGWCHGSAMAAVAASC